MTTAKLVQKKKDVKKERAFKFPTSNASSGYALMNKGFAAAVAQAGEFANEQAKKAKKTKPPGMASASDPKKLEESLLNELEQNGSEVNDLCEIYGLKRDELGRLTGFSVRALADWAAQKLPSLPAQRRLREVQRFLEALSEIVKPDAIPPWLHKRNEAFEGMTPLQVIEVGEIDRLWSMIHRISAGQPG